MADSNETVLPDAGNPTRHTWGVDALISKVVGEVEPLAKAFSRAGQSLYLVGGIVRDVALGAPLDDLDFDLTTEAHPGEIKRLLGPLADAIWTQGEKFGTIGAEIDGRPYEVTTFRAESYSSDTRKPEVQFGDRLDVDLSRRDFTINAMAIDVQTAELIDPFDGISDLEARVLRTPIEPHVSFSDDPLRMLRAARFIARYNLRLGDDVEVAARELSERMSIVSVERIREELDKLLAATEPSAGLAFLAGIGLWPYVVPTIDTDELTQIGVELDGSPIDPVLRRTIIFSHCARDDRQRAFSHLKYSNAEGRELRALLEGLDVVNDADTPLAASAMRRLVERIGYDSIPRLFSLLGVLEIPGRGAEELFSELDSSEDLRDFTPILTGEEVMELLSISPGPEVGAAIQHLKERRFEGGPTDRDGEVDYLRQLYEVR